MFREYDRVPGFQYICLLYRCLNFNFLLEINLDEN